MDKIWLQKRSNGIYYLRHRAANGKESWRSTGKRTKREALAFLQEDVNSKPRQRHVTMLQLIPQVLEYVAANHAKTTVVVYRSALSALVEVIGDKQIDEVTKMDVDKFKGVQKSLLSPISVNIQLRTLRAAFNLAVRWELIEKNPFTRVQQFRIPEASPTYLTFDQFNLLRMTMADHWIRDIVIFAVYTGLRKSEILNLEWRHVDMKRNVIHVTSTETFKTKAGKSRIVPLNEAALSVLAGCQTGHQYVFTYKDKRVDTHSLTHAFKRMTRAAGLPEAIHFHSLRHTFASWLVQDGVSLFQVGKLLGHTTTKTTEIYAHLQPETMHDAVDRLRF
jgi:site-specific recombinase XerD